MEREKKTASKCQIDFWIYLLRFAIEKSIANLVVWRHAVYFYAICKRRQQRVFVNAIHVKRVQLAAATQSNKTLKLNKNATFVAKQKMFLNRFFAAVVCIESIRRRRRRNQRGNCKLKVELSHDFSFSEQKQKQRRCDANATTTSNEKFIIENEWNYNLRWHKKYGHGFIVR